MGLNRDKLRHKREIRWKERLDKVQEMGKIQILNNQVIYTQTQGREREGKEERDGVEDGRR